MKKMNKKSLVAGLGGFVLATSIPFNVMAASIYDAPNTSIPSKTDVAPAKYEFIAQFNSEKSQVEPFGGVWTQKANIEGRSKDWYSITPNASQKGKIGVKYTNVGMYEGEELDLIITVNDWHSFNGNQGSINYSRTQIGHITQQYDWVDQIWRFVKHGTMTPVQVSGFMTINDLDYQQQFTFSKETAQKVDKILVPVDNSKVAYNENGGAWQFYASGNYASNDYDNDAMFTFLYSDASELHFRWGRDNSDLNANSKPDSILASGDYFGYLAKKPIRTETLVPAKKVSDKDESQVEHDQLTTNDEVFTYDVYHTVPDEWKDFYYQNYTFEDKLADVLNVESVKILTEEGKDVTNWFKNESKGNALKYTAMPEVLQKADFYHHTYNYKIATKIKEGADLSPYVTKDGSIQIHNQANVTIDNTSQASNDVITEPVVIDSAVVKHIDVNGKLVEHQDLKKGQTVQYKMDFQVPNNQKLDSLVLWDDMEDVLDLAKDSVKVMSGDKDVTAQGTLTINEKTEKLEWTAKQPSDFSGQTLTVLASAKVKQDADLTPYTKDGKISIGNVAHMKVNDKDITSNEVTVTPEQEKVVPKVTPKVEPVKPTPKAPAPKVEKVTPIPKTGSEGSGYKLLDFVKGLFQ